MKLNEFISADHSILVVNDVPSALKIVTRLLKKLGVKNVSEGGDGEDAMKKNGSFRLHR